MAEKRDKIIESLISSFHDFFTDNADERLYLGITEEIGSLSFHTGEDHDEYISEGKKLLARLRKFTRQGLSFDQQLDLELAELAVEQYIFSETYTINDEPNYKAMPTAGTIGDSFHLLLVNDPRPSSERLDDITSRMEEIPKYLLESLRTLDTPVKRWVDIDVESVNELPNLFDSINVWAEDEDYNNLGRLQRVIGKAKMAFDNYVIQLRKLKTTTKFSLGVPQTEQLIKMNGIDVSLDQLQAMAKDSLRETSQIIDELRPKLLRKYSLSAETTVEQLHAVLNKRYTIPLEKIIGTYEQERYKVLQFIQEHDLFVIPEDQEMVIVKTPSFMVPLLPAGAVHTPFPFAEGIKKSIIYLTLSPELVDEHTILKIPMMTIHEGIPGHHLQHSSALKNPSVIRKHWGNAMDMAEGWTTMLEDYMLDIGYAEELADEVRFCEKLEARRFGARVAIDLYFMTGEKDYLNVGVDTDISSKNHFRNAENLLRKATGFTPERVKNEINWYSQSPGYPLSYLVGNKLVWKLKEDMAEAQKGKLAGLDLDRLFHKTYLEAGCMPLKYLRRVFEENPLVITNSKKFIKSQQSAVNKTLE